MHVVAPWRSVRNGQDENACAAGAQPNLDGYVAAKLADQAKQNSPSVGGYSGTKFRRRLLNNHFFGSRVGRHRMQPEGTAESINAVHEEMRFRPVFYSLE